MDLEMKPTQSFEDRPRSFSLTATACVFILLLAYVFSCVPGLEGAGPRRPASRQIPFQLPISTPEEQGMDVDMLAAAYGRAAEIPHIYSMLVVRHGRLVAEEYFDAPIRTTPMPVASVGKSILGALVGIAVDEGYVSLDQRMIDFFPEYNVPGLDRRKRDITIRHLVQMRAGYPSDSTTEFFNLISNSRDWFQLIIVDWPLERSPGTGWAYSNAGTHLLSGILTRATEMSLLDLANRHLFGPMGHRVQYWPRDPLGYCVGPGDVNVSPLQLALFGQMILKNGYWRGMKILEPQWVTESLEDHSETSLGQFLAVPKYPLWLPVVVRGGRRPRSPLRLGTRRPVRNHRPHPRPGRGDHRRQLPRRFQQHLLVYRKLNFPDDCEGCHTRGVLMG